MVPTMIEENPNSLDILIVGGKGVGKSSLFLRYVKGCRPDTPPPTADFDFESKLVTFPRESVKLNIWDTSGMEEFDSTLMKYYQVVHGILLVYDVTNQKSLENLGKWLSKLDKHSKKRNAKKILVANKKDKNFVREISMEEGIKFAKKIGASYTETSAKNGENVVTAFENLVKKMLPHNDFEWIDAPAHQLTLNNGCEGQSSTDRSICIQYSAVLDILMVGESGVGKSSLLRRFTSGHFDHDWRPTIGVDYRQTSVNICENKLKLRMWDPSGLEKFQAMLPNYYRSAHGVILVYDVTSPKSFGKLGDWLSQISEHSKTMGVKKMVVGNKTDLDNRLISEEEGCNFAQENGTSYMETSAKENCNVVIAFEHLVQQILLTPGLCKKPSSDSLIRLTPGDVSSKISKPKQASSNNCC